MVALSSTEAVYRATTMAAQECTWLLRLIKDLGQDTHYTVISRTITSASRKALNRPSLPPLSSPVTTSKSTSMPSFPPQSACSSFSPGKLQIEAALPTLVKQIMSLDSNEDAIVGALKQSLRQLETLGLQRAGLEDMLKGNEKKDLFEKEIAKYDSISEYISQNLDAQEQLLMQIQAQMTSFLAVFNLDDYKVSCERSYKKIEAAIAKYRVIKENINEGLRFYVTLQTTSCISTRSRPEEVIAAKGVKPTLSPNLDTLALVEQV